MPFQDEFFAHHPLEAGFDSVAVTSGIIPTPFNNDDSSSPVGQPVVVLHERDQAFPAFVVRYRILGRR
jgi:hypothetical protein